MTNIKKHLAIGPGGMNCICCFEPPSSKGRKYKFKQAKRKQKLEALKIEQQNMEEQ